MNRDSRPNGLILRINHQFIGEIYGGDSQKAFIFLNSELKFDNSLRKLFGADQGLPQYEEQSE